MIRKVNKCRICGNSELISVLNLGEQYLTGIFPRSRDEKITCGPLELVKCSEEGGKGCGLLQLRHSYELGEMYGNNYGYRSGLNQSMVRHLQHRVHNALRKVVLTKGELVVDIGSNDSTLLQSYPQKDIKLLGIDPTGVKFKKFYPKHIDLIPEFFSADVIKRHVGNKKVKILTSIAMFYDLEDPVDFMRQVADVLADDGVWVFEQSYMPQMLQKISYDTICHEHLEYYGLKQIKWMTDQAGLKILDVEFNGANGGSFAVTAAKLQNKDIAENARLVEQILRDEQRMGLSTLKPYEEFKAKTYRSREALREFVHGINHKKEKICGYGASTKGNVILQFCGFTSKDIPVIGEVNPDKFGCVTPGTNIPIAPEADVKALNPQYLLVLPWHFKESIVEREKAFLASGGTLVMPLPQIELVTNATISVKV